MLLVKPESEKAELSFQIHTVFLKYKLAQTPVWVSTTVLSHSDIIIYSTAAETETPRSFGSYNGLAPQLITKHFLFFVSFNHGGICVFVFVTQLLDLISSESSSALYVTRKATAFESEKKERKGDASAYLGTNNTPENAGLGPDTKALGCKILEGTPLRRRAKVIYLLNGGKRT